MNLIKLSEATPILVTFENDVVEFFFDEGESRRIHITHIKGMTLDASGKGKYLWTVQLKNDPLFLWVDEGIVPKVNELISEMRKASAAFKA